MSIFHLQYCLSLAALLCAAISSAQADGLIKPEPVEQSWSPYLVGGDPVPVQPWMAALVYRAEAGSTRTVAQRQFCGGTLIAPSWVLTAAHCVDRTHLHEMQVLLGRGVLDDAEEGQVHEVADLILHPDFEEESLRADIALLRLATPSAAQPLPLGTPDSREMLTGQRLDLYGWGQLFDADRLDCEVEFADGGNNPDGFTCGVVTYRSTNRPSSLMHAQLTLHDYGSCERRYRAYAESVGLNLSDGATPGGITAEDPVLCAWDDMEQATLCYGDSGGPLVGHSDGRAYLVGISSFMQRGGCELPYQLSFFTEVGAYRTFITEAQTHDARLSLSTFCPGRPRAHIDYRVLNEGRVAVTLQWDSVLNADAYTLHVVPVPFVADGLRQFRLDAPATEYSTHLAPGQRFLVSVQAHAANCDGPPSQAVEVNLP